MLDATLSHYYNKMASCQRVSFQILEENNLAFSEGFVFDSAAVDSLHLCLYGAERDYDQ